MAPSDHDLTMLAIARQVSEASPDPSTQCGAVITRPDGEVVSVGWNRFPARLSGQPELYWDRPAKYARITHAEVAAIVSARADMRGCMMHTWPPGPGPTCRDCALMVIEAGLTRVVHLQPPLPELGEDDTFSSRWANSCRDALALYDEARVDVVSIPWEEFSPPVGSLSEQLRRFWDNLRRQLRGGE